MNTTKMLRPLLAIAMLAGSGIACAQDAQPAQDPPSVDSIINSLKADPATEGPGQTRGIPGLGQDDLGQGTAAQAQGGPIGQQWPGSHLKRHGPPPDNGRPPAKRCPPPG